MPTSSAPGSVLSTSRWRWAMKPGPMSATRKRSTEVSSLTGRADYRGWAPAAYHRMRGCPARSPAGPRVDRRPVVRRGSRAPGPPDARRGCSTPASGARWRATVRCLPDGTAFVLTGDIPAMWLRDSAAQVRPYLALAATDAWIADLLEAVVRRQLAFVCLDPYANAFNASPGPPGDRRDRPLPHPEVWERKYEVDSLSWPLLLAHDLWRATGRTGHLGQGFAWTPQPRSSRHGGTEQDHDGRSACRFLRPGAAADRHPRAGTDAVRASSRPAWHLVRTSGCSDDACTHGYHVPGNMLATVGLAVDLGAMAEATGGPHWRAEATVAACGDPGRDRRARLRDAPPITVWSGPTRWTDRGGALLADDANLPSLLALPYLGWCAADDPVYRATRRLVPVRGEPVVRPGRTVAAGIGSPHTPPGWGLATGRHRRGADCARCRRSRPPARCPGVDAWRDRPHARVVSTRRIRGGSRVYGSAGQTRCSRSWSSRTPAWVARSRPCAPIA